MEFSRFVEGYKYRNLMKPGITGLAQIKGFRGPARSFDLIFRRYQWDAFYIRNARFLMDLWVIHCTGIQTLKYIVGKAAALRLQSSDAVAEQDWAEPKGVLN
jgi:putative colanic acid biosynthesis UDP-glucose lipid carrier transferase